MHITLEFLGELSKERLSQIQTVLEDTIPRQKSFHFRLDRLGGFPNFAHPKVLFVGVGEEQNDAELFHSELQQSWRALGIEIDDHDWHPHITLGRIKREWHRPVGLQQIKVEKIGWRVDEVQLVASELTSTGPVHTIVAQYHLTG